MPNEHRNPLLGLYYTNRMETVVEHLVTLLPVQVVFPKYLNPSSEFLKRQLEMLYIPLEWEIQWKFVFLYL